MRQAYRDIPQETCSCNSMHAEPLNVFLATRKVMRQGGTTSMGNVAQIAFAASLAAWGIVVITDPVGKSHRKT
uniref:Uncharacterized protein n=1 Tax=Salmo trutta TaxID=8032 RepID=A0A674AJU4_SALTR